MAPRWLILATRNAHKVREFERLLAPAGIAIVPLPDDVVLPPEEADTFAENALPKARAAAAATGAASIADDSGIEAEALGGRPGVHSARFAGPDATDAQNLAKLIEAAPAGSGLRYVCALALVDPIEGVEVVLSSTCAGTRASHPSGEGGFGYDPIFLPEGSARTMAELSDAEKDAISHRGGAARELIAWLEAR
jgi:XTP/dITP diphosphohydrolase